MYQKVEWKNWCELVHQEDEKTLKVAVTNSSFTGQGGCKVNWTILLPKTSMLEINQAAGEITGVGQVRNLLIDQAAGSVKWKKANMPCNINLAAGNLEIEALDWPKKGSSLIKVATGNIHIKSPKNSDVATVINKAIGSSQIDFPENNDGHKLKINVAVGKIKHTSI